MFIKFWNVLSAPAWRTHLELREHPVSASPTSPRCHPAAAQLCNNCNFSSIKYQVLLNPGESSPVTQHVYWPANSCSSQMQRPLLEHFLRMTKTIDLGNCKPWLGAYFSFSCEILSFRVFQADQLSAALPRFTTATSRLCWRLEGLAGVAPYCAGAAPYEVQRS